MTGRVLPSGRSFGRCGKLVKISLKKFSFTARIHHLPLQTPRALALPFIKTRSLVPKKFEKSKKAHIAPSQRLVAKVHQSHTSLSKGIFFRLSQKKVRIHCLCLCARPISTVGFSRLRPSLFSRCESRMPEHNLQSRINKSFADKRLPHLKTLLQLSHRLTLFPAFYPLTSRIRPRDEDFVKSKTPCGEAALTYILQKI